jgi:hypothetical protein
MRLSAGGQKKQDKAKGMTPDREEATERKL